MRIARSSYSDVSNQEKTDESQPVRLKRATGESLLISALINSGDPEDLSTYGVEAFYFEGFPQIVNWVIDQAAKTKKMPTKELFSVRWPDFPLHDHDDVGSAMELVKQKFYERRGRDALVEATEALEMGDVMAAKAVMDKYQPMIETARPATIMSSTKFLNSYYDDDGALGKKIALPYRSLDTNTGGMRPGNFFVLAARTGEGKSSHAVNIAAHATMQGKRVLYYSLEMSTMEMRGKLHAVLARKLGYKPITALAIRDRNVDRKVYEQFLEEVQAKQDDEWGDLDVHTPAEGPVSPQHIISRINDYDLVVVDLITLMRNAKGEAAINDWRVAAGISNEIKQIALGSNVPILGTSQINREGGGLGERPPRLSQLSQTDSIGQDADAVITMRMKGGVATTCSIEKSRHGQGRLFWTKFDPNHGDFSEITEAQAEDLQIEAEMAA